MNIKDQIRLKVNMCISQYQDKKGEHWEAKIEVLQHILDYIDNLKEPYVPTDINEAAACANEYSTLEAAFKAGAWWMSTQGGIYEAEVISTPKGFPVVAVLIDNELFKEKDKVTVVVRKQ